MEFVWLSRAHGSLHELPLSGITNGTSQRPPRDHCIGSVPSSITDIQKYLIEDVNLENQLQSSLNCSIGCVCCSEKQGAWLRVLDIPSNSSQAD